jgi:hypothetical protein
MGGESSPRRSGLAPTGVLIACVLALSGGCANHVASRNTAVGATIGGLMVTPSTDLEQTYYLGSFDPREQLPPTIYRIRVRGQSSFLNLTRFASSWVPAAVVDSLTGAANIDLSPNGKGTVEVLKPSDDTRASLDGAGRRLMLFGPEGFRKAPEGYRLVIIMGSSPEQVEEAFSSALGTVAAARFGRSGAALDQELFSLLLDLGQEREQLKALGEAP